jgi:hypothetical protein
VPPRSPSLELGNCERRYVIVPEVYAVAAAHNVFSELPTDPGVTDEMRSRIKDRATMVLGRMSDITDRIGNMDAMGVDVQVLSASLVQRGRRLRAGARGLTTCWSSPRPMHYKRFPRSGGHVAAENTFDRKQTEPLASVTRYIRIVSWGLRVGRKSTPRSEHRSITQIGRRSP